MKLSLIVAVADNNGIGLNNALPWGHIKEDMAWFKENTKGKPIVMGSNTWHSLPKRPLPLRDNIVLSSKEGATDQGAKMTIGLEAGLAIEALRAVYAEQEVFIIGGAKVYNDFIPFVSKLYITRVHQTVEADTFLDIDTMMNGEFVKTTEQAIEGVTFQIWEKQ